MSDQFWMVWNPNRNPPMFMHATEVAAEAEAERLAKLNPGERFFVLEAIGLRVVDNMQRVDLRKQLVNGDGLPF